MAADVVAGSKLAILGCVPPIVDDCHTNSLCKGSLIEGAWSKLFADYKPKYFSRLTKSAKSTYFRKKLPININFMSLWSAENLV